MNASIITIGDELLIGQVIDTNSAWMAQELNQYGIKVIRRVAVGDVADDIRQALDEEIKQADIILITGGLGPTADDITKPLLCDYFNGKLIIHQPSLDNVKYLFEQVFKRPITERNLKQAEVPDTCTVIVNKRGSAPGMWFEKNGKIIVSMPGVPHEMKGMMQTDVIPQLIKRFNPQHIEYRTMVTFGIGESAIADMILDFETSLPSHIKLAYLPNFGQVRLRLTGSGSNQSQLSGEIDELFLQLQQLLKDFIISSKDASMESIVGDCLLQKHKTMATAESCTGGYIAHLITAMPGSSAFYNGSVVSYTNEVKEKLLAVDPSIVKSKGAVSEEVVIQMLSGVLDVTQADFGVAVSGIMGPDGGSDEKPVGTVWMAAGSKDQIRTKKFHFRFDRQRNIQVTAINALNLLRECMVGHDDK